MADQMHLPPAGALAHRPDDVDRGMKRVPIRHRHDATPGVLHATVHQGFVDQEERRIKAATNVEMRPIARRQSSSRPIGIWVNTDCAMP